MVHFPFYLKDVKDCRIVAIVVLIIKISSNKASFADIVVPNKDCLNFWLGLDLR